MVPFITRETTFGQHVRKLVLGVSKFDLDLGVSKLILSNKHERDSVRLDTTSAFDDHLDHRFVVFENRQLSFTMRKLSFVTT